MSLPGANSTQAPSTQPHTAQSSMSTLPQSQDEPSFNLSFRTFMPRTSQATPKRRMSTFSTPSTEPRTSIRQSVLRRGKTVWKRAVSSATGPRVRKSISLSEGLANQAAPTTASQAVKKGAHASCDIIVSVPSKGSSPASPSVNPPFVAGTSVGANANANANTVADTRSSAVAPAGANANNAAVSVGANAGEYSGTAEPIGNGRTTAQAASSSAQSSATLPDDQRQNPMPFLTSARPLQDRHASAPHMHKSWSACLPLEPIASTACHADNITIEKKSSLQTQADDSKTLAAVHAVSKVGDSDEVTAVDNFVATSHVTPSDTSSADRIASPPSHPAAAQPSLVGDKGMAARRSLQLPSPPLPLQNGQPGKTGSRPSSARSASVSAGSSNPVRTSLPGKASSLQSSMIQPASHTQSLGRPSDKPKAANLPRNYDASHRMSLSDMSRRPLNGGGKGDVESVENADQQQPAALPNSLTRQYASSGPTVQSLNRQNKPTSAQSYVHQRRSTVAPKPSSHSMSSTPPIPASTPAARVRDSAPRPPYQDSSNTTRISRTGFMERSVAAAVISAARHRTHAKKNRQPLPTKPPHHRLHGGYSNPWPSAMKDGGLRSRSGSGSRTFFHKVAKDRRPPDEQLATMLLLANRPDFPGCADAVRRDKYALATTWIGHSTFYIHARGLTVLTDPVWSSRLGPLGPKRLVPPPCAIDELPQRIDVVILSSASYDHYDKAAIQELGSRVGVWLVPLGLKALLMPLGLESNKIVELDWWDEHEVVGCRFVCTPAQHSSIREDTLWCSWSVQAPHHRFFYCGASGYRAISRDAEDSETYDSRVQFGGPTCPAFKEIGHRYGPFDTAFLPVGGYKPRVLMSGVQGDAVDMLFVHRDLRSRRSIAHRWGTFASNDEGMLDAVRMLEYGLQTGPVSEHEFCYLKHGRLHVS